MELYLDFKNTSVRIHSFDIDKKYKNHNDLIRRADYILDRLKNLDPIRAETRLNPVAFFLLKEMLTWDSYLLENEDYCYLLIKYGNLILQNV